MAFYNLKIETTDGEEPIILDENTTTINSGDAEAISSVHFKMNTLNDDTLNRSSAVRCEMVIKGQINNATKDETLKLANWAKIRGGENKLYRKVTVEVFTDKERGTELREYEVDKMFCIDYDEEFIYEDRNQEEGTFTLYIAQKEGTHTTNVFCE